MVGLVFGLLLAAGVCYTIIYWRTDNLFVVVGAHTMGNAPTTLFATAPFLAGDGETVLIYLMIALAIFLYPMFRASSQTISSGAVEAWGAE